MYDALRIAYSIVFFIFLVIVVILSRRARRRGTITTYRKVGAFYIACYGDSPIDKTLGKSIPRATVSTLRYYDARPRMK
jgi:hypothetical protein